MCHQSLHRSCAVSSDQNWGRAEPVVGFEPTTRFRDLLTRQVPSSTRRYRQVCDCNFRGSGALALSVATYASDDPATQPRGTLRLWSAYGDSNPDELFGRQSCWTVEHYRRKVPLTPGRVSGDHRGSTSVPPRGLEPRPTGLQPVVLPVVRKRQGGLGLVDVPSTTSPH